MILRRHLREMGASKGDAEIIDKKPWHEDDQFWEQWGPMMFTQQRLANTPAEVEQIINLLDIRPEAKILDLCCGIGRHSLEFTRRGFQVTGVDRTQRYLSQATEQANREGLHVEFIQDDMRTFCRPDTYDAVINMSTSFSYFEDPDEDRQVIANVYHSLKSGGSFILETHGKETLARIFQEKNWEEIDGTLVLYQRQPTRNWGWMENRWIMIKDNKRSEYHVSHRLYSATELVGMMTETGFARVDVYGDLSGSPYDHIARRLVLVARK